MNREINSVLRASPGLPLLGKSEAARVRRLRPLLKRLILAPDFRASDQAIYVPGHGRSVVNRFFVSVEGIADAHIGQLHGFWRLLTNARRDDQQTLWLNTGGRGALSFCLDPDPAQALLDACGNPRLEDLAGAHASLPSA